MRSKNLPELPHTNSMGGTNSMKHRLQKAVMTVAALLLAASVSFAAEAKKGDPKTASRPVETSAPASKGDAKSADAAKPPVRKELVDINSASEAELKSIAGIGDAYAARIIAGRPYANKTQLKTRGIIPGALYEQIREQVIAKQGKKEDKKPSGPDDKPAQKSDRKK